MCYSDSELLKWGIKGKLIEDECDDDATAAAIEVEDDSDVDKDDDCDGDNENTELDDETVFMKQMGLPVAFGNEVRRISSVDCIWF